MPHVSEFTIGWICALSQELVAAQEFLDEEYESREVGDCPSDNNSYSFGSINGHKIVIAVLPKNQYGHVNAAVVARDMSRSFSNLRFGLMVGVGGGAPSATNQMRLGDVVVSSVESTHGAVFQYDFGKTIQEKKFIPTGYLNQPPQVLQIAVASLSAKHTRHGNDIHEAVQNVIAKNRRLQKNYSRPDVDTDRLFFSDFVHEDGTCCSVATSQRHPRLVPRDARSLREDDVVIHYGLIASANQVLKDAVIRDRLATEKNVLCFEMEAAGLMNHFPCLVIRGICDYSDTHKNKAWQGYAAMTAAAYAKSLLELMVPQQVVTEKKLGDVLKESLQSLSHSLEDMKTRQKTEERAKQLRQVMEWLAPPDPRYDFDKARKLRQGSTGTWLLEDRMFQSWKGKANSFLWINGKVGSGKTILSSTVIAELKSQESHASRVLFYFFTFSDVAKQSLEGAIKSLIVQAYVQIAQTREPLDLLYRRQMDGKQAAPLERLCETFSNMIQLAGEVWIVLDALDESTTLDDHRGQGILPWMKKLHEASLNVHVLVTSRPEPDIGASFSELDPPGHTIYLGESRVSSDIDDYIDSTINDPGSFRKWDHGPNTSSTSVKARIKDELKKKAGGMFRWVSCQIETLSICSDHDEVRRTLEDLPGNLHDTYSRILKRIDDQSRLRPRFKSKAIRLLQFLIFSERPLLIEEAVDALTTKVGTSGGFNPDDRMKDQEQILEYCSGLVVKVSQVIRSWRPSNDLQPDTFVLQLAHVSVKEYLTSQQMDNQFLQNFTPGVSQNSIAETCLSYLLALDHEKSPEIVKRLFPFAKYCAIHWADHQAKAEMESDDVPSCMLAAKFLTCQNLLVLSFRLQRSMFFNLGLGGIATALLYSSEMGLFHTIGTLSQTPSFSDPAALRVLSNDALCGAAGRGHTKTVSVLLQKVKEMNAPAINLNDALVKASEGNHWEVTSTLISYSAGDTRISNALANALATASKYGYVEFVQRLLQHGAEPSERALTAASRSGYLEIVQVLIEHRADVQGGALTAASSSGHFKIVQFLLEHGADVQGGALTAASRFGYLEIVQVLLKNGADVPSEALISASSAGRIKIVQVLLEHGADAPSEALTAASSSGRIDIVQLLLEHGADVPSEALTAASSSGRIDIVQLLLEHGADAPSEALTAASSSGRIDIIQLLLKHGADVPSEALTAASRYGYFEIVQLLLENGANAQGRAVAAASNRGYIDIVRLLLEHGADVPGLAFVYASRSGYIDIIRLLLEHEADVPSEAVADASHSGYIDIVRLLLEHGAGVPSEAFVYASNRGYIDIVRLLLEHGADVPSKALTAASGLGHIDIVRLLSDYCMAQNSTGFFGNALQTAMDSDHLCVVRLLLEKGAIMEKQSIYESNVLEIACARGHDDIVKMVLEREPRPNESNISYYINNVYSTRNGAAETKRQFVKTCEISRPLDRGEYYRRALCAALSSGHQKTFVLIMDRIIDEPKGGELYTDTLRATIRNGPEDALGKLMEQLLANQRLYDFVLRDARSNKWENVVRELHSAHDREEGRDNDMAGGRVYA